MYEYLFIFFAKFAISLEQSYQNTESEEFIFDFSLTLPGLWGGGISPSPLCFFTLHENRLHLDMYNLARISGYISVQILVKKKLSYALSSICMRYRPSCILPPFSSSSSLRSKVKVKLKGQRSSLKVKGQGQRSSKFFRKKF